MKDRRLVFNLLYYIMFYMVFFFQNYYVFFYNFAKIDTQEEDLPFISFDFSIDTQEQNDSFLYELRQHSGNFFSSIIVQYFFSFIPSLSQTKKKKIEFCISYCNLFFVVFNSSKYLSL